MKYFGKVLLVMMVILIAWSLMGARHTWNKTVMIQTYNRFCEDLVDSVPRGDDTTSTGLHFAVGLATTLYDSILIVNEGDAGAGGTCSLAFRYDCGYDTLGTYKFTLADSGTLAMPADVYLDSIEVYIAAADTPFALKFTGYTKYSQE